MRFALTCYGTRGDIEPSVAVGRELLRRGHEVRMGVPPDLVGFSEAAGLATVTYGLDTEAWLERYRNFWTSFFGNFWKVQELVGLWREYWEPVATCWAEMSTTATELADGADLLLTSQSFQEPAANVAEYYDIPLATLHNFPVRPNGQLVPGLPSPVGRSAMTALDWVFWHMNKKAEDTQRRELGLPKATAPSPTRIAERGSLEIQAYDDVCFPGLATEWAKWDGQRPFIGALTMELTTDADDDVASWIAAGTPPSLLRLRQHCGRIRGGHRRNDQHGLRAVRRAGVDMCRRDRLQRYPDRGSRQSRGSGELCGHLPGLPCGGPSRWCGHHGCEPARRGPHADPLDGARSDVLGSAGQTTESRHRSSVLRHHAGDAIS